MEFIQGIGVLKTAQRKAKYGHKDWIYWVTNDGEFASPARSDSIKKMLLAVGTRGRWYIVGASNGILMKGFWWLGLNILRQSRGGYF